MKNSYEALDAVVGTVLSDGVDTLNKRIYLQGAIEEESAAKVVRALHLFEGVEVKSPVTLYLDSCGGNVMDALALLDAIVRVPFPVTVLASGSCYSAATLIAFCSTKQRHASKHCQFMVHNIKAFNGEYSTSKQLSAVTEHTDRLGAIYLALLAKNSNKSTNFWKKVLNGDVDYYFDSQEALDMGLIDKIV